jgi:hypothetical protein
MTMELDFMNTEEQKQNDLLHQRESLQKEFEGYYYDSSNKSMIQKRNNNPMV